MSVKVTARGTRGKKFPGAAAFTVLGRLAYRLSGGRGQLLVTTKGAKSGQERQVVVKPFWEKDGKVLVVGSKGGTAAHPSWFINIARHPESVWIDLKGKRVHVRPESLAGEERARAWKRIVGEAPNFGGYEKSTDREIPVVRLSPIE